MNQTKGLSSSDPEQSLVVGNNTCAKEQGTEGGGEHKNHQDNQQAEAEDNGGQEEHDVPITDLPNPANANPGKIFGTMRKPSPAAKGNDVYNYEEKYPEDATYKETTPNARVWRTYKDESRIHDANIVEQSQDNVNVLLVFAGLFSAVVITLVVQTSQNLQPNYAAMSASLLYESVLV
ncbi:hypothetical protein EV421DRAFT_1742219 [Armillaria borealis]|uniref:DUF6535 domain-containing protein n=1 Tax=Armillaria borealis TaxID=47425 RepID=A0AA39IZK3_9AGAR|nr:hypothetical protein EV421DRAFT_1742219 [Armillaria borealis]